MRFPQQDQGDDGEGQVCGPGPEPGREDLVPAQGLAGFDAAVEGEAEQDAEAEAIGQAGAAGVGAEGGAEGDNDKAGEREGDLQV